MNRSQQTSLGIKDARQKGAPWGAGGKIQGARNKAKAEAFAEPLEGVIFDLMTNHKCYNPNRVARELNRNKVPAANGGSWHRQTVVRLLERYGEPFKKKLEENRKKKTEHFWKGYPK